MKPCNYWRLTIPLENYQLFLSQLLLSKQHKFCRPCWIWIYRRRFIDTFLKLPRCLSWMREKGSMSHLTIIACFSDIELQKLLNPTPSLIQLQVIVFIPMTNSVQNNVGVINYKFVPLHTFTHVGYLCNLRNFEILCVLLINYNKTYKQQ